MIEHLVDPARVFADLARLVERLGGPTLVVSIPNVTHIDIATKLLLGRWDMTTTGLLDDTHVTFFDHARVDAFTAAAGFVEVDRRDKQMTVTEQEFPLDHPAVSRATTLRQFAEAVRELPDDHRDTYQFVRAYRFDAATATEPHPRCHDVEGATAVLFGTGAHTGRTGIDRRRAHLPRCADRP